MTMKMPGKKACVLIALAVSIALLWLLCLPRDLFGSTPYSTVVEDRNGELIGARIADDGQWRFPQGGRVPEKFATALVEFEDRGFWHHPGFSVKAIGRAMLQNIRGGHTVSGASTITMQVIRLSRGRERTLWQKCVEVFMATRLELRCSKDEILSMYAANAPFGGNVVGLDAAMWRYLGRGGDDLSWAEAATLAVLPNSPSSINLERKRGELLAKRNRLLSRLHDKGCMDDTDYLEALDEPLIGDPHPLPSYAPHLVEWYDRTRHGERVVTDMDIHLQKRLEQVASRWRGTLAGTGVNDLAIVVVDVHSGRVPAYVGNAPSDAPREGAMVDAARSPRSSGSILKPLLYRVALDDGMLLPDALLPDLPMNFGGFSPKNFDRKYSGAVPASKALAYSLNVPHVYLLKQFGVRRFCETLKELGVSTLYRDPDEYGLSLILGGAEVTLYDITMIYAAMAADAADPASWCTLQALAELNRPDGVDWRRLSSARRLAWKTGTSYGSRDAWAVGVTPDYAVGVWAGNADGRGCPELTGSRTAGPVLFDAFQLLPKSREWFPEPAADRCSYVDVCTVSGWLAGPDCKDVKRIPVPSACVNAPLCPYHRSVNVSLDGKHRVEDRSEESLAVSMFVLPPAMEWYYRQYHPDYVPLPPLALSAQDTGMYESMKFIYPADGAVLSVPRQMDGSIEGVTFSLAHSDPSAVVYWHLDDEYLGATSTVHSFLIYAPPGPHAVTAVDSDGNSTRVGFVLK